MNIVASFFGYKKSVKILINFDYPFKIYLLNECLVLKLISAFESIYSLVRDLSTTLESSSAFLISNKAFSYVSSINLASSNIYLKFSLS